MTEFKLGPAYTDQGRRVAEHWSRLAVTYEGAIRALQKKGILPDQIAVDDLHALDMLHMGELASTDELATLASIAADQIVLDAGSGVGGPARRIASKFGASVWGLELSDRLIETAEKFTELVGLLGRVRFKQGSALVIPFDSERFDAVIIQHVAMQISEKEQLFAELTRVVKPGGCLALHEIFAGEGKLHYPLAWATERSMSALEPLAACCERLSRAGFDVGDFVDHSEDGRQYHAESIEGFVAGLARGEGAYGLSRDVTEARRAASVAMERNLRTGSLKVGMLVSRKSGSGPCP